MRQPRDVGASIVADVRKKEPEAPGWNLVSPATLSRTPPPPREWIVQDWLPIGAVTANYGDGGLGKTLAAQLLQTSCSARIPWLGLAVMPCRSVGLYCEDDDDELHRRQIAACDAFNLEMEDLADMAWVSGYGQNNILADLDENDKMQATPALYLFEKMIEEQSAKLAVLDTAADLYPANENDRSKVRQFIALLNGIAHRRKCAVLLNAHPSKDGLKTGNIDGGSTAWSNSVRSRWSLERAPDQDGDDYERILTRRKANYAATGTAIRVRWHRGVLLPVERATGLNALASQADADAVFLRLLAQFTASGVRLSQHSKGQNFAPKLFAKSPNRGGLSVKDLEAAMMRLLTAGRIKVHDFGRPSRPEPGLIITAEVRDGLG